MDPITISTVVMAVVTTAYCIITFLILKANQRAVAAVNKQIEASIRPYVVFDIIPDGPVFELVLQNSGQTAAINVAIEVSPPFTTSIRGHAHPCTITDKPFSFLSPGRVIREFVGNWDEVRKICPSLIFKIKLEYSDLTQKKFAESFTIDLNGQDARAYIGRPDLAEEVKKIAEHLDAIKRASSK